MKAGFYFGILLCAIVVVNTTLWIMASLNNPLFDGAKQQYLGYFPSYLKNAGLLTFLSIALSSLSIYLLTFSLRISPTIYRRVGQVVIALDFILISGYLYTLL